MKKLLLMFAAVGMLFTACNKDQDCGHEFIEYDNTKNLVGTWTYLEEGQAEAMVIKEDGSFTITGVMNGGIGALYEEKGTIKVVNNKVTLAYNSGDVFEGRLELVAGKSLSIILNEENDIRLTYDYCANDLSDEIIGMWVSLPDNAGETLIQTFKEDGTSTATGVISGVDEPLVDTGGNNYKVVGNLLFLNPVDFVVEDGIPSWLTMRATYTTNGSGYGDIMSLTLYGPNENEAAVTTNFVRVKQNLNLAGKTYDYNNVYVSNVKGEDKDIEFFNTTINFAKLNASALDKFLNATIFSIMFPDANTIKYSFLEDQHTTLDAPIVVEGNKMTIKMSTKKSAYKDVVVYAFQDADNTQMHIYMPTASFEAFFANGQIQQLEENGLLDINNAEAIAEIRNKIETAIDSINISFIFKTAK